MNADSERDVTVRVAVDDELVGVLEFRLVASGGSLAEEHTVAPLHLHALEHRVDGDDARVRPRRRVEAEEFLGGDGEEVGLVAQALAVERVLRQVEQRGTGERRRGVDAPGRGEERNRQCRRFGEPHAVDLVVRDRAEHVVAGDAIRSRSSSAMRFITGPYASEACRCSALPAGYAETPWKASENICHSSRRNPIHSNVTAAGTGQVRSCTKSHSPRSTTWSRHCAVQKRARVRSRSDACGERIRESERRYPYHSGGSDSSGRHTGTLLAVKAMADRSGSVRADEKRSQSRNAAPTAS